MSKKKLTFAEYQKFTKSIAIYPDLGKNYIYPTLGLAGEAGEVTEIVKKLIRDKNYEIDDEITARLEKELGDVLWYVSQVAAEFGLDLEKVAQNNVNKLSSRKERGKLHGDGDNR
jgi:NTP pyrophosphatase (non-canonical NTP hydrolase)